MEKKIKLPELEAPVLPVHAGDKPVAGIIIMTIWLGKLAIK